MLDLAVLGLLEERELHGYEIRRLLRQRLGMLANVSFGSIYPALNRLEAAGAVETIEPTADGPGDRPGTPLAPPTGSLSGELAVLRSRRRAGGPRDRRGRKVYRITPAGRRLFGELLAGAGGPEDARSFDLRLALARHLAPQARLGLLERRRSVLVQTLADIRAAADEPGLDVYARSVVEHSADAVGHDIAWLDRLMEFERAVGPAPQHPQHPDNPQAVAAVGATAAAATTRPPRRPMEGVTPS